MRRVSFAALVVLLTAFGLGGGTLRGDDKKTDPQTERDKELKELLDRNQKLEAELKKQRAEIEQELAEAKKQWDEQKKEIEKLREEMKRLRSGLDGWRDELRERGSIPLGLAPVPQPPPPLMANLRGEVTDVAGDLLTLDVGIDSGMAVGTMLDVYRLEKGGKFLGTVKVASALNLFPKQAIVTFTSARKVPLDKLPEDDLPKKGDLVRPPDPLTGGR
jgi:seryl-tRNA synthetase